MDTTLTSPTVCDLAGLSYRQLDRWCRMGVVHSIGVRTPGSGFPRRFTRVEARVITLCARLNEVGASTDVLRAVADHARALDDADWNGELIVSRSGVVAPRIGNGTIGEACWIVNLELVAARAAVAA